MAPRPHKVPAIKTVGVKTASERIAHVTANAAMFPARLQIAEPHDRVISIACYGPSLADTWQSLTGDVLSIAGSHHFLLDRCIVPEYHVECDPRDDKMPFFERAHPDTTFLMASVCHPRLMDMLCDHKVVLWHIWNGKEDDDWVEANEPDYWTIKAGSTAGLNAIMIAYILGYRTMHIHGMDSSSKDENSRHAGPHYGKHQTPVYVTCGDRRFLSTNQMISAAREYFGLAAQLPGASLTLHGDGLLQTMAIETMKLAAAQQRRKLKASGAFTRAPWLQQEMLT